MNADPNEADNSLPATAVRALQEGNLIAAIKIVRDERRLQLKPAKDFVDTYVQSQPALRELFAKRRKATQRTLMLLAALVVAVVLVYGFLKTRG